MDRFVLMLLNEMAGDLSAVTDLAEVQRVLAAHLRWQFNFTRCTLAVLFAPGDRHYQLLDVSSPRSALEGSCQIVPREQGWPGTVLDQNRLLIQNDLHDLDETWPVPPEPTLGLAPDARSLLVVPLRFQSKAVGSLNLSAQCPGTYPQSCLTQANLLAGMLGGKLGSLLEHQWLMRNSEIARRNTHLERQMQELRQINQVKDEFLSTASHELRTPMTNIHMAVQLLRSATDQSKRDRYFDILQQECEREVELLNDLLDMQRLETGTRCFNFEPIDLRPWFKELLSPFEAQARNRSHRLSVRLPVCLRPMVSDRVDLRRILGELLSNACKYTPREGKISLTVSQDIGAGGKLHTRFCVSNSGPQLSPDDLARLFDKFYRIPERDFWGRGGTGLGLTLLKKLVEQMHGIVQVTSNKKRTVFSVCLPDGDLKPAALPSAHLPE